MRYAIPHFIAACLIAAQSLPLFAADAPSQGAWRLTGGMHEARERHTATLLQNGKVLVVGGDATYTGDASPTAELYDQATGAWQYTGSLGTPRVGHTATLLNNGKVLIAGGRDGEQPLASAELYDPTTGAFAPTGSMTTAEVGLAPWVPRPAVLLATGKVLFAGDNAELYDPVAGTFALAGAYADMAPVVWNTATSLPDGRVLLIGFISGGSGGAAELFDPQSGTFSITGPRQQSELSTATLLGDGTVLGLTASFDAYPDDADVYDPASGTFTHIGQTHGFHAFSATARLNDGTVLISGGQLAGGDGSSSAELYLPATRSFVLASTMIVGRDSHTATLLPDGTVLIAGGIAFWGSPLQTTASAEVFTPANYKHIPVYLPRNLIRPRPLPPWH